MKKSVLRTVVTLALLAGFLAALYFLVGKPMIAFVGKPEELNSFVESKGFLGLLIFGAFFFIQSLSTCIPGLPFYLAAGYILGGVFAVVVYAVALKILKKRHK